jgi:hypothetical protein
LPVARHGLPGIRVGCGLLLPGGGVVQGLQPTTRVDLFTPAEFVGDVDLNGQIGLGDLAILLSEFGSGGADRRSDFDRDGDTDLVDLARLLADFGRRCA